MKKLILLTVLVLTSFQAQAQSPAFTYQGRLATNGVPVEGTYDFEFRLFDDPAAGNQLSGVNSLDDVVVSGGVFTVTLDFGDVHFDGDSRHLEIAVRPGASTNGYTALNPRQRITATPYAIQSASAGSAEFLNGTISTAQLTGTLSSTHIAPGTITGPMIAGGAVGSSHLAAGAVTGAALAASAVGSNHLSAGAVTTTALAGGAVTSDKVFSALSLISSTVITNPTPLALDQFGAAVAVVGTDRILVGANLDDDAATNSGAAHLFDVAGNLLVTLDNPSPGLDDNFGSAVAAVGVDKLLVGAYQDDTGALNSGSAYLFSTSGDLLLTINNPTPAIADGFGYAVAAVGPDRLLVGSLRDNPGGGQFGAAFLYDLAGNLVQSFTNPTPANLDSFGVAVAAVGTDKVLIGASNDDAVAANSGVAHLFSTNGSLLLTLTNPTPAAGDNFGSVVVAVGTDKVLITAPSDATGAADTGAAYLFDLTGTLLASFFNPTPASGDGFGSTAAAVGTDRVLIGAATDDTGASNAGSAYLFDLAGNLILTFTNPAPGSADLFGAAVAALNPKRIVVGARQDDRGVNDAGAVFVLNFDTFTPGLVADSVRAGGVDSASIAAGAIQSYQLASGAVRAEQLAKGAVTTTALAQGAVTADKVATATNWFALTIANPRPAGGDLFGWSVAAVGSDRVLIGAQSDDAGASGAGAAYLFNLNGALLTTFINPTPSLSDFFGNSVAAVGSDRVLIGAENDNTGASSAGAAYLFNLNGALLTTFTNPTPEVGDYFGHSVAAVGSDRVLIGAVFDNTGGENVGAAYLFSTNGALLTTFTNPTPEVGDFFGRSVAAVGSDWVLIGAESDNMGANGAGAAYLFSTNGTLLTTFTNPTPALDDFFGISVAAVGSDRVLIGAERDNTGASAAGAAYLFGINGALLTTFTNPTPALFDRFGNSVAAVGSDRVLIGAAFDDTGTGDAGAAYLFSTNGALLTTFTNPTPAVGDSFGFSLAALGNNQILIGARDDDTGASGAGAAYLFSLENYTPELIADSVSARSVGTIQLEDGAVTLAKLHPTIGVWSRSLDNVYRLEGNVGIGTTSPTNKLHVIGGATFASGSAGANQVVVWTPGSASWSFTSDRNTKDRVTPVNSQVVLEKLTRVPIHEWSYIGYDQRHIGPMAQDFHAQFPLNENSTALNDADLHGVALAAIQGLNHKVEMGKQKAEDRSQRSEDRIQKLETENTELKQRLEKLERLLAVQLAGGAQ